MRILPGRSTPLGATWNGQGVNFALFSEHATSVELCLFDSTDDERERFRIRITEVTAHVWHCYVPGLRPGQLYGYRVHGPYQPESGLRFNPAKLLLDPYAKAIAGRVDWQAPVFAYRLGSPSEDLEISDEDDAWGMPKGVVIDDTFDWGGDQPPAVPWPNSVIYETHVRGFTKRHPDLPPSVQGTYTALGSPVAINYLKSLGVTAVELLPIHAHLDDKFLVDKGLTNYWGYNTLGFFAPEADYASVGDRGDQVTEFKTMVKALHSAGIEVILDVVYNHTCEGNHLGPTLSWKGMDNSTYYRLTGDAPRYYMDYTGTGNSLNVRHPQTLKLIMDSLRYWVTQMHVDGFRFDLASTLARELHHVDRRSGFFDIIHQDPILSQVKLIAEPWDVGEGGYQVGNFPILWAEWNGRYRDSVRRYWRGDEGQVTEMSFRLAGSSDLYGDDGRHPFHSINFVTAHDGFTLRDLVSYDSKHNEANKEGNQDGENNNHSWNCGEEGPTDDPEVNRLRTRQQRNFLATLLLSQGVPMILGGDEFGRTQHGNNNAYCQDNETSWYDWNLTEEQERLLEFSRQLIRLRREQPSLRRHRFFHGHRVPGSNIKDVSWHRPDGREMTQNDWQQPFARVLGMQIAGKGADLTDEHGAPVEGDTLLILLNSSSDSIPFTIPALAGKGVWEVWIDTDGPDPLASEQTVKGGSTYKLAGRSLALLRKRPAEHEAGANREVFRMNQLAGETILDNVSEQIRSSRRLPLATYRIQFNSSFTFQDARRIVPYLASLGISDCYCSPYLKASPGSSHGYDICDHRVLNPELGTEEDYNAFSEQLKRHRIGQIMDVVPNHMSVLETANPKWTNVLENGPASPDARFFDIDWHPLHGGTDLNNTVLLPVLGSSYGETLENQELKLRYENGAFFIDYYDHAYPVAPKSYLQILEGPAEELSESLGRDSEDVAELRSIITAITHLPERSTKAPEQIAERQREKEVVKRRLKSLTDRVPAVGEAIQETVTLINGRKGDPRSFDRLHTLLNQQAFRLAHWRVAAEEINYRRFFDINELAAIRTEDPVVFEETHRLVFRLLGEGKVTGLRVDHPDGLLDPGGYFAQIQKSYLLEMARQQLPEGLESGPGRLAALEDLIESRYDLARSADPDSLIARPLYLAVEKILTGGERLPTDWPVHGTTGYDFLNAVNGIFVNPEAARSFDALYKAFTGRDGDFREMVNINKKMIMLTSLASEISMLAHQLKRIALRHRRYRDFTLGSLTFALREIIAALPVYRTYIATDSTLDGGSEDQSVDSRDRGYVEVAVREAKRRNPRTSASLFDFIGDTLLLRWLDQEDEEDRKAILEFVHKYQQNTGPVMAKGVEDTSFYTYNRLISLNEVGGNPGQFGIPVASFHQQNLERQRQWPYSMVATSTHDTKRSEDVRARIDVLSEIAPEWRAAIGQWSRSNRHARTYVDGRAVPDTNDEYYFYQTLIGAWPFEEMDEAERQSFVERMTEHALKAAREAKVNTSWINQNLPYEEALVGFVRKVLSGGPDDRFLGNLRPFARRVAHFGIFNSLSQTLLKIASPGVPDFYQGSELWNLSLVDPDNRRPVDYERRIHTLDSLRKRISEARGRLAPLARELVKSAQDGRIKMYLAHQALLLRRAQPDLFAEGAYIPLNTTGKGREHTCAFARRQGHRTLIVVVPRLIVGLTRGEEIAPLGTDVWEDSLLVLPGDAAGQRYRNVLTGETLASAPLDDGGEFLSLARVLATFPVALMERVG